MQIGVLALQGDFAKHMNAISALGVMCREIKTADELQRCDGLILPGGESTSMRLQISSEGLQTPLLRFSQTKPVFGTCAGLILMAKELLVFGRVVTHPLGWLDITVERNGYGRQIASFREPLPLLPPLPQATVPAIFIRAPCVRRVGERVIVLAKRGEEPVFLQQGMHLASAFHPELTEDRTMHRYFLDLVQRCRSSGVT